MLIKKLIDKRYCVQLLPKLKTELDVLKYVRAHYRPQEKYTCGSFVPEKFWTLLKPIVTPMPERCRIWQNIPYERNPFPFDESENLISIRGDRVRSRFECIVADRLTQLGLSYKVEAPLLLMHGRKIYPDFTVMHPTTGDLFYIELFGMMDVPEYALKNHKKIQEYALSGKIKNSIFIFDYKGASVGTDVIDAILKSYFS